jgi:hypothetical protein
MQSNSKSIYWQRQPLKTCFRIAVTWTLSNTCPPQEDYISKNYLVWSCMVVQRIRRQTFTMQVLEDAGVFADVTLGEYPLDLIPFDEDVLSLELDAAYKELLVDGDRSCLYDMAKALWRLQVSAIRSSIVSLLGGPHEPGLLFDAV